MATTTWTQTAGMTSDEDTDNLESYAEQAEASKDAAAASETAAAASAAAAAASEVDAESAEANASASEASASASAASATSSATAASNSASSASTSAASATSSATAAAASETAAAASESAAATSESNASTSETNAATSASNASTSETNAATSATNASTSETNAAASETAAAASETAAAASEAAAVTSETNAATSEANAATSETNASNSASSASTSASNAATSATSASNAQTAAEAARDATLTAYDNFDDRYLGTKASAPTLDNDGNALIAGALYFDSTAGAMRVYTGSAWVAAYVNGADYLALSGGTMTGDVAYGDNVKATFGASADLQVFHDGSNSFIKDTGSGNLRIDATNLQLRNGIGTETYANFTQDGGAELYYDNSKKLETTSTGIDVTGTVVADGLTVDGVIQAETLLAAPAGGSSVGSASAPVIRLGDTDTGFYRSNFNTIDLTAGGVHVASFAQSGNVSFYEDTGTTPKFFWDASNERLGLGTTSPDRSLSISNSGTAASAIFRRSDAAVSLIDFRDSTSTSGTQVRLGCVGDNAVFYAGAAERMRITSAGDLEMTGGGSVGWANFTFVEESGYLYVYNGSTKIMRVDASGNAAFAGDVEANATL